MKRMRLSVALLMLLLSAAGARAQWSANMDVAGGFGFSRGLREFDPDEQLLYHLKGMGDFGLTYRNATFTWKTRLTGSYESVPTHHLKRESRLLEDDYSIDALLTIAEQMPFTSTLRSEADWQRAPGRDLRVWIQYRFDSSEAYKAVNSFNEEFKMSIYADDGKTRKSDASAGVSFSRWIGSPGRVLAGSFAYRHLGIESLNMFLNLQTDNPEVLWANVFIVTPFSTTDDINGNLHFRFPVADGAVKLVLDPGFRLEGNRSIHENSGATSAGILDDDFEDYVWRDSTQLSERFNFQSLDLQPYLAFDLSSRAVKLSADYGMMLYSRRLTDACHNQGLKMQRPYLVGKGRFSWQIGAGHSILLTNTLSVRHPGYLQVCWYDRSGGYIDRLYRGNQGLKSNVVRDFGLEYAYRRNRFSISTSLGYQHSRNEIVETWFWDNIDGRKYQVFTWINGADSKRAGVEQRIGWNGKYLSASLGARYNQVWQHLADSDKAMRADDMSLRADFAARFGKGWTVSADAKYQSKVASFFAIFSQYCTVNARISKSFKKLTLYIEGRDLADTPSNIYVESADGTQINEECSYLNRRIVLLGCKWNF